MPSSPGQGLSSGDSSRLCFHIMPCIPQTCPGSITCLLCGQAGQPACRGPAFTQTAGQQSIHSLKRGAANFLYPRIPEQGLSLGDSSQLCSPSSCLTFPRPALGLPSRHRALGGARVSIHPHFPFSVRYYHFLTPHHHQHIASVTPPFLSFY